MSESLLRLIAENRVAAKDNSVVTLFHILACVNKYFSGVSSGYINETLTQKYIAEILSKAVYERMCKTSFWTTGLESVCTLLCKDSAAEYKKLRSQQMTIVATTLNMWHIFSGGSVLRYEN